MSNKGNTYLASKPRYEILDGLRGVAALLVLVYHHFELFHRLCLRRPLGPYVALGAWNHVTGRSAAVCKWLGNISYPLYVTHYGIVFGMVQPWYAQHPDITTSQAIGISLGSMLLSVFIAHSALKLYDEPVRQWLREHWLKK